MVMRENMRFLFLVLRNSYNLFHALPIFLLYSIIIHKHKRENLNMDTTPTLIESLFERIEALSKTTIELSKLRAMETTTNILTVLISRLVVFMVLTMFIVLFSIGFAFMLGDWLRKPHYGFFIVASFYLVLGIILYLYLPKWLKRPLIELIIPQDL